MKFIKKHLLLGALCFPTYYAYRKITCPSRFKFAVLADQDYYSGANVQPYVDIAQDTRQTYLLTIDQINKADVDFSVHLGDMQLPRYGNCSEENLRSRLALMNGFDQPLMFTPADNDWSDFKGKPDCPNNPLETLSLLRSLFYPTNQSLGKSTMTVERQVNYPENQYWHHKGIVFGMFHTLGPDNMIRGGTLTHEERLAEQQLREAANICWIKALFTQAKKLDAKAVILFTHADRWEHYFVGKPKDIFGRRSTIKPAFKKLMEVVFQETKSFAEGTIQLSSYLWPIAQKHVYLFYGDSHTFMAFRPMLESFDLPRLEHYHVPYYMEVQAPGPSQGWVEVDIDFSNTQPLGLRVHGFAEGSRTCSEAQRE